jgi:hypothetical protein
MPYEWDGKRKFGNTKCKRAEYFTIIGRKAENRLRRKYIHLEYVTRMRHSVKTGRRKNELE